MNEEFWNVVCAFLGLWHLLAVLEAVVGILLVFTLLVTPPNSGSFVVAVMGLAGAVVGLGLYAAVRRGCVERHED